MAVCESIDFSQVPLIALRSKTRYGLSQMLNATKVIPSPSGLPRDWRGLGHIAATNLPCANSCDPTSTVIENWSKSNATFKDLIEAFKELDRWDVLYDTFPSIEADATMYFNSKHRDQKVLVTNTEVEELILTVDDIQLSQKGEDFQIYDAFLLYSDEDVEFAMEIVDKLENQYGLKLCLKDRDLVGGITFEHEAVMRLISERCNRLIIVVSPSFLNSPANKFFVNFAQALGIEQGRRKIIPCIYKRLPLPLQLRYYYMLDYTSKSQLWDFWKKLSRSIASLPENAVSRNLIEPVSIRELPNEETKQLAIQNHEIRKPEEWSCPEKNKNTLPKNMVKESAIKSTDCDLKEEQKLSVNSLDSSTSSKTRSMFRKVLPKSLKGKSRTKNFFKSKKKALMAS